MVRITHLGLAIFWILMAIPAVIWFKESILFVILMSLYANIEASFAAFLSSPKKSGKPKRLRTINLSHTGSFGRSVRQASAKRLK